MLRKIYIIGMGALGVLFGHQIKKHLPESGSLKFIADPVRIARYRRENVSCNGEPCNFEFADSRITGETADLIIFATKTTGLADAMESVKNYVGENTLLLSVLNGISSEIMLAERFGDENVVKCIARGMDAVKLGSDLNYHNMGVLVFGAAKDEPQKQEKAETLHRFFTEMQVPHIISEDIDHTIWNKFMMNVGLNQSMMVYETNYGGMQQPGEPRDMMLAAMREVVALSRYEGIALSEEDILSALTLLDTLSPDGFTSMRQDAISHRPTEVESFAGTVLKLAEKHSLDAPANRFLYDKIREMEANYGKERSGQ